MNILSGRFILLTPFSQEKKSGQGLAQLYNNRQPTEFALDSYDHMGAPYHFMQNQRRSLLLLNGKKGQ